MHSISPLSVPLRYQVRCFQQFSCTPWTLFLLLCGIRCAVSSNFHALHGPCFLSVRANCGGPNGTFYAGFTVFSCWKINSRPAFSDFEWTSTMTRFGCKMLLP